MSSKEKPTPPRATVPPKSLSVCVCNWKWCHLKSEKLRHLDPPYYGFASLRTSVGQADSFALKNAVHFYLKPKRCYMKNVMYNIAWHHWPRKLVIDNRSDGNKRHFKTPLELKDAQRYYSEEDLQERNLFRTLFNLSSSQPAKCDKGKAMKRNENKFVQVPNQSEAAVDAYLSLLESMPRPSLDALEKSPPQPAATETDTQQQKEHVTTGEIGQVKQIPLERTPRLSLYALKARPPQLSATATDTQQPKEQVQTGAVGWVQKTPLDRVPHVSLDSPQQNSTETDNQQPKEQVIAGAVGQEKHIPFDGMPRASLDALKMAPPPPQKDATETHTQQQNEQADQTPLCTMPRPSLGELKQAPSPQLDSTQIGAQQQPRVLAGVLGEVKPIHKYIRLVHIIFGGDRSQLSRCLDFLKHVATLRFVHKDFTSIELDGNWRCYPCRTFDNNEESCAGFSFSRVPREFGYCESCMKLHNSAKRAQQRRDKKSDKADPDPISPNSKAKLSALSPEMLVRRSQGMSREIKLLKRRMKRLEEKLEKSKQAQEPKYHFPARTCTRNGLKREAPSTSQGGEGLTVAKRKR